MHSSQDGDPYLLVPTFVYSAMKISAVSEMQAGSIWLKADVWSFGATLYHMLAGKRPRSHLPEFSEQQPLVRLALHKQRPDIQPAYAVVWVPSRFTSLRSLWV